MAYVPDPTDVTQPVESVFAKTAAAEFRALKAYIQGLVTGSGQLAAYRNMARNGSYILNQRGAGTITGHNGYVADGWKLMNTATNRFNVAINSVDHPAVFRQTLKGTVVVAGAPAAGDFYGYEDAVEGVDVSRLLMGTASARASTVSFWVYSSVAGTFAYAARNSATNRSFVKHFTVTTPNTWERITLLIPGDTAGTWLNNFDVGIRHNITVAAGSSLSTATLDAWQAGNFIGSTTQTQLTTTGGAVFYLAEFQHEQSSFATPFEYMDFGQLLRKGQRYWQSSYDYGAVPGSPSSGLGDFRGVGVTGNDIAVTMQWATVMRAAPTIGVFQSLTGAASTVRDITTGASVGLGGVTLGNPRGMFTLPAPGLITVGRMYQFQVTADADI